MFVLANLTLELTVVVVVVGVLALASLIALAPLKKVRLPYTVAVMLAGFGVGAIAGEFEQAAVTKLTAELLDRTTLAELQAERPATLEGWRERLGAHGLGELRALVADLDPTASQEAVAARLEEAEGSLLLHLTVALGEAQAAALGKEFQLSVVDQLIYMIGTGGRLSPSMIFFVFLPPLVFESAFNLEVRQLLKNLVPVCVLAVPVLILSTGVTGAAVMLAGGEAHGLTWEVALLFGALISATDPVAVVALFKGLGAPKRLGVLVEGESLFNDGTAIVLFNILLAMAVASYGAQAAGHQVEFVSGVMSFFKVSLGGIAVGLVLSWLLLGLIGRVTSNEHVEISISVVLAYASFVLAEHFLHVSGVMATVTAGLMAGSYGRTKVSPSVTHFMHSFWDYLGFVMNSLIFFFVGLVIFRRVSLEEVKALLPILGATLLGMIAARALGVFGSVPFMGRFAERIDRRYQTVMFWGGLRGAVSLALALIVFTHPDLPDHVRKTVLVLASGVVLFTLLVNALTMEPLIVALGLDRPTPVDRFALAYAQQERLEVGSEVLSRLEREGAVLPGVLNGLRERLDVRRQTVKASFEEVADEIQNDPEATEAIASRIALAVEKREVLRRFDRGELTEAATKRLLLSADHLFDRVKAGERLPEKRAISVGYGRLESRLLSALEPIPLLGTLARRVRSQRLAQEIEVARGLYLAARTVQQTLAEVEERHGIDPVALANVQARYSGWRFRAEERLHRLTEEFPDYARSSQELLAELQTLRAEAGTLRHLAESGLMTDKALGEANADLRVREAQLLRRRAQGIELDPVALLRAVPAFQSLDDAHAKAIASKLVSRTFLEGELVVKEGEAGDSMFLIARGGVGVFTSGEGGVEVPLSTFGCGEFFGEIAAILGCTRRATVRAVTPVNLLELSRGDLSAVLTELPEVEQAVRASVYPRAVGRALVDQAQLSPLSAAQRRALSLRFVEEAYEAGTVVHAKGAPHKLAYITSGAITIGDALHADGKVIGAGAFVDALHDDEVVAKTDVRLLVLPPDVAKAFSVENPATADAIRRLHA